jgi:hypothetical protein
VFIFACWIANGTTDVNIIIHFQQEMNLQYPHTTLQLLLEVYFPFGPNSFVTCNELKIVMTTTVMTITYGVLKHNRTSFLPGWTWFPPLSLAKLMHHVQLTFCCHAPLQAAYCSLP